MFCFYLFRRHVVTPNKSVIKYDVVIGTCSQTIQWLQGLAWANIK